MCHRRTAHCSSRGEHAADCLWRRAATRTYPAKERARGHIEFAKERTRQAAGCSDSCTELLTVAIYSAMGFFTQRCPNCSRSVSKDASHCSHCGCPTATSWAACDRCGTSVGAGSKFCWKCGAPQDSTKRDRFFGDRWRRSPGDFAVRIELKVPGQVLHRGLQIDDGTLALVFQSGVLKGTLEPGCHTTDGFFSRLLGLDKNTEAHAILLDTRAAEVDFMLESVRVSGKVPVDVRVRLLFQISDPKAFVASVVGQNELFVVNDLAVRFHGDVRSAVEHAIAGQTLDQLVLAVSERELLELGLVEKLQPVLAAHGLKIEGVRLAQFGGPAYDEFRQKLGQLERLTREAEASRQLRDALRTEKVATYRDEQEAKDAFDKIAHDYGLAGAEREELKKRFVQAAEHQTQLEGLRLDYDRRRAEILNRLDEQKLRHQSEIADARHGIELKRVQFEEDIRQQQERFKLGQGQQVEQSKTDLEVAKQGIEALKLVRQAKLEVKKQEDAHELSLEGERMKLRGSMSVQALVATLTGEQADRVLKLAELEMRRGLTPEQALALVAEKSPEIAPAIAEAIKGRASTTSAG